MTMQPPFALFVLAKDIDVEYLNTSLKRAWEGNYQAGWQLWVAGDSYDSVPKQRDDGELAMGTEPPLPESLSSPWTGKTVEDCAKWLQEAPSNVAVNRDYFTAINEFSKEDDTVLACRVLKKDGGEIEVEFFPQSTDTIAMESQTNSGSKFDEKAMNYQRSCMKDGKPDRSQGRRYQ